jgi:tripartite-type tricarboxylate transporter receptor subunit TctC
MNHLQYSAVLMGLQRLVANAAKSVIALVLITGLTHAQTFPNRSIKLVVPYAAGGSMDLSARIVAGELTKVLGQPVIVDNRAGGAGTVGTLSVVRSVPDGYTICYCVTGVMTISPIADPTVGYKPLTDLLPISQILNMENVLMAKKDLPANNLAELIALSKTRSSGLTFGSPGAGGTHHLSGEWLKEEAGIQLLHIPYRGEGPAVNDLLAGQIDLVFGALATALPHYRDGKIKLIASLGRNRSKVLPQLKTVSESGFPNYYWSNFAGLNAPAGTPAATIEVLEKAAMAVMRESLIRDRFQDLALEPVGSSAKDYGAMLVRETETWTRLVKLSPIKRD